MQRLIEVALGKDLCACSNCKDQAEYMIGNVLADLRQQVDKLERVTTHTSLGDSEAIYTVWLDEVLDLLTIGDSDG